MSPRWVPPSGGSCPSPRCAQACTVGTAAPARAPAPGVARGRAWRAAWVQPPRRSRKRGASSPGGNRARGPACPRQQDRACARPSPAPSVDEAATAPGVLRAPHRSRAERVTLRLARAFCSTRFPSQLPRSLQGSAEPPSLKTTEELQHTGRHHRLWGYKCVCWGRGGDLLTKSDHEATLCCLPS